MRSLVSRLEKLENDRTGEARLILVRTGAGHTRADVSKMLKSERHHRNAYTQSCVLRHDLSGS